MLSRKCFGKTKYTQFDRKYVKKIIVKGLNFGFGLPGINFKGRIF